ncbi:MAG: hypothetical protein HKN35_15915 [Woeseia sp.]|nr:hypothetical protein [Woeseia sp.]
MSHKLPLSDSNHPAWAFGRYALLMMVLSVVLWQNASNFDMTEIRSLVMMGAVMLGWGVTEKVAQKKLKESDDD